MITNMLNSIPPDTIMLLANAIYFKGTWTNKFNPLGKGEFTTGKGKTVQADMMTLDGKFAQFDGGGFRAIRLPYGDEKVSMVVFAPYRDSSLAGFVGSLTGENWNDWMSRLRGSEMGTITMPKFRAEFEIELNDVLKSMGINAVFGNGADLSKMIERVPQYISEAIHKAVVEVDENGTKAAAVTMLRTRGMGGPFHMLVNGPFFFAIVDNQTDLPIFMGTITDPTQQ
jgi:serpin B